MKKFISFSGGVESSTMCVLFGNKADAIFADTGFEHKVLYDRIKLVENWVKNFHRNDFKIHVIKAKAKLHGKEIDNLPDYITEAKFYPSFKSRYCTGEFKIKPIDNFLEQYKDDGVELMIGLNADEIEQRTGNHGNKSFVKYSYPLADNGITRAMCEEILRKAGMHPNFPVYMKRGGCIGCYYKSINSYTALALLNPEEFKIVEDLENAFNEGREDNATFFKLLGDPKKPSMKDIRLMAKNELFSPDEVYATINDATKCGVFCNR